MALHPLWEGVFDPDQPIRSVSDLASRKAWHGHPLYGEVFRPDGIEDQLNMEILGTPEAFTTVNILRGRRGFTLEERDLFARLRPHLTQAFHNTSLAERAGLIHAPADDCWLVPVDHHGRIVSGGDVSLPPLGHETMARGRLPVPVEAWIQEQARCLNEGWMETQLAPLRREEQGQAWLFTLYRDMENGRYLLSAKRLIREQRTVRLSPREAEVIDWVAAGKTNEEIAVLLGMSLNTVKTHLKRSFIKLGVENRTAAVSAWSRLANRLSPKRGTGET